MGMLVNMRDWIDARFPMTKMWEEHLSKYYAPKNFNFWYFFGSLALMVLVIQIISGIFLTMSYKPAAADAFASVEYIMRDVDWGWLIRYIHSTGDARRGLGLADSLYPLDRCIGVLPGGVPAHVPWFAVWLLPGAA